MSSKITNINNPKKRKNKISIGLVKQRTIARVLSLVSMFFGALLPLIFINWVETWGEAPISQLYLAIYLILVCIVNLVSGYILIYQSYRPSDIKFLSYKKYWVVTAPFYLLLGAFLIAIVQFYLWRVGKNKLTPLLESSPSLITPETSSDAYSYQRESNLESIEEEKQIAETQPFYKHTNSPEEESSFDIKKGDL